MPPAARFVRSSPEGRTRTGSRAGSTKSEPVAELFVAKGFDSEPMNVHLDGPATVSAVHSGLTLVSAIRAIGVDPDEDAALARVVAVGLDEISGAEFGGFSEPCNEGIRTRASSDDRARLLDCAQYEAGEGPCLTAAVAELPVISCPDLATDQRWPDFGHAAAKLGVSASISFRLFDSTRMIGALNLYAGKPHAFGVDAEEVGMLLAAHAAVVVVASRKQANLNAALTTRDVIGQAKGILMERYKLDDRQAFAALIAVSQHTHRKLREVADEFRTTGELPGLD